MWAKLGEEHKGLLYPFRRRLHTALNVSTIIKNILCVMSEPGEEKGFSTSLTKKPSEIGVAPELKLETGKGLPREGQGWER